MNNKNKFIYAFSASLVAWLIHSIIVGLIMGYVIGIENWASQIPNMMLSEAFLWVPFAILNGFVAKRKGIKASVQLIVAGFIISLVIIVGCFGMFKST